VLGEGLSRLQPGAYLLNAPSPVNAPFPGERLPQSLLVRWGSCIEHLVLPSLPCGIVTVSYRQVYGSGGEWEQPPDGAERNDHQSLLMAKELVSNTVGVAHVTKGLPGKGE